MARDNENRMHVTHWRVCSVVGEADTLMFWHRCDARTRARAKTRRHRARVQRRRRRRFARETARPATTRAHIGDDSSRPDDVTPTGQAGSRPGHASSGKLHLTFGMLNDNGLLTFPVVLWIRPAYENRTIPIPEASSLGTFREPGLTWSPGVIWKINRLNINRK